MNSFSTLGSLILRGKNTSSVNSASYILQFTKNPTVDFSGSSFVDLSAASSYAPTACGLNIGNENSSFARLKYNGNYLKTSDFNTESEAFTFHLKHAARYSTLPPFIFQYPNVLQLAMVSGGSSFTTTFYSFLTPGTVVPYAITGCTSADLNQASLTGSFTSPYQINTYSLQSSSGGKTIAFNVSGGTSATLLVPTVTYTVTYVAGTMIVKDSNLNIIAQPFTFASSSIYLFEQSDASNLGMTALVFSTVSSSYIAIVGSTTTSGGTPGNANAYTMISTTTTGGTTYIYTGIYYVSVQTNRMGNLVFALSTVGQDGPFYSQQDVSFGAGSTTTFDVSHPSMGSYTMVFGTTRNGTTSETYVTRSTNKVVLTIPNSYNGANIYFYANTPAVSSYITPVITYKGAGFLNGTSVLNTVVPSWVNTGLGMVGITPDGNRIAFGTANMPTSYGVVYDYSSNTQIWNKSITSGANGANYQFYPKIDSPSFNYPNHNYYLNYNGKICAITSHNVTSGYSSGVFAVYEFSDSLNAWYIRGSAIFGNANTTEWLSFSFDTDYSFNWLVAGTNTGNYFKIYNYNSSTNAYVLSSTFTGTNNFGRAVRMNDAGTKIIATSPGYYTSIYTRNVTTSVWSLDYSISVSTGIRTPYNRSQVGNWYTPFISKDLDVYLSVDASKNILVYTHDLTNKTISLRNIIPEYPFFAGYTYPSSPEYGYTASLSGNGNRILILGGWVSYNSLAVTTFGTRGIIYDYNKITNTWTKSGEVIDSSGNAYLATGKTTTNKSWFGSSFNMSYDGTTIVVGDAHLQRAEGTGTYGSGAYHVFNCLAQEMFVSPVNYLTVSVSGGVYWISTNGATTVKQPNLVMSIGNTYKFDTSHISNVGYPLGLTYHNGFPTTTSAYNYTSPEYTTDVVKYGTIGSAGSYLSVTVNTTQPLYYYCTNAGTLMGYIPPLAIIKYTFEIENGTVVANSGTAGTSGNGTIAYINTTSGSTVAGTQTISYDSTTFKIGSKSLYNNIYSGASSYVQLPSVSFGSSKMTYCCWMKLINIPASTQIVPLSFESTAAIQNNIRPMDILVMKYTGTNHVFMNFQNQANYNYFDKTSTADFNNTWKHITITVDTTNNVTCMYTDGVKNTSLITPTQTSFPFNTSPYNQVGTFWKQIIGSPFPTNTAGFRIMCAGGNNSSYTSMNGYIDDYRIYNTILTDAEILSIYQNTNYNF